MKNMKNKKKKQEIRKPMPKIIQAIDKKKLVSWLKHEIINLKLLGSTRLNHRLKFSRIGNWNHFKVSFEKDPGDCDYHFLKLNYLDCNNVK